MEEISVLDYLKFKLNPKNFGKEILPAESPVETEFDEAAEPQEAEPVWSERLHAGAELVRTRLNPYLFFLSLIFALAAQIVLEPNIIRRTTLIPWIGGGLYAMSAILFVLSFVLRGRADAEVSDADVPARDEEEKVFAASVRYEFLALSLICALGAFLLFGGNRFTFLNVMFWILSLILALLAFSAATPRAMVSALARKLASPKGIRSGIRCRLSLWNLLCICVFALCAFFMFHDLTGTPVDMVSDHAEKLYDIRDILEGHYPIFFTRNTGREFFQFYFTALIIKLFGTGLTFLSLKIGTALAGLFILPFVYKLGKMLGNRWVGLFAMLLCGVSYWPIVIGRAALRFAYYPMFTAPALYYLLKGLKERSRKDLILSGIFLGLGLHGYSPFRIVPVAFAVFFVIFLLKDVRAENRGNAFRAFLVLVLFAFLVFLPLARVMVDMPEMVLYRSVSRLGESEKAFDFSPFLIFIDNFWKGLIMPFWSDGSTWVHSIVYRPALEHLTASFFFIGLLFMIGRILRQRRWEDICLVLAVPLMMLPSTLSLAFPAENPCLNRTAGTLIPVMVLAAAGLCGSFDVLFRYGRKSSLLSLVTIAVWGLITLNMISHNYDLIFRQFSYEYNRSAWNTSQIGKVIEGFANSIGTYDDAFVIPYPHWVDTRLVGINAGDPHRDYSFDKSLVANLPNDGKPRLFIYRVGDTEAADTVRNKYPNGIEQLHTGPYDGKDFYVYTAFSGGNFAVGGF